MVRNGYGTKMIFTMVRNGCNSDKHASVDIPVILAEYFEIWIIESNLNGYCLNCSELQSSAPGRTNLYGHQYYKI